MGNLALDTRSASALQNLGKAGADRAILSHSPPPPVSYTHLDVYKRQEQLPPKGVKREQAILALGKEEANGELFLQLVNTERCV